MGLRGPGATRLRLAKEAAAQKKRALPWRRKGLNRAERVIAFLEFLPVTKGILAGKRMKLLPGQRRFVERVYGARKRGPRPVTLAIKSEPKGNGKTGLIAGLALCHLLGPESEPRGECYSAAIDRGQAGLLFNEMEAMIVAVPEFAARVNVQRFHKRIEVLDGDGLGSIYEALSQDARRAHGPAPSFWAYDELAQAKSRELLDNLMEAMGKRKESLGFVISTQAPSDDHPLSQLIDDARDGLDPTTLLDLTCAPEDADPWLEGTIRACNPALGVFLNPADVMKSARRARRMPAFEPAFRNLRLNQRVDANADARLVPRSVWELGDVPVDPDELRGRECYAGLDLSGKHDLTALVLAFPDGEPEVSFDILPFFWTPIGQMGARRDRERRLFEQWIKDGHLTGVEGPVIRYGYIARKLAELSAEYDLRAVGYDRWRIDDLKTDLDDIGCEVPLEPFGQGFKDMAPAIEWFAELALDGRLRHGAHPVLTACIANAILSTDPAGNQKFDKQKANQSATVRIDGAVAAAMALGTAKRFVDERPAEIEAIWIDAA